MHNDFRKLLEKAIGASEFVIAINLDIRGFSKFSKVVESPEVAMYIKRVYMKLIDEYFNNASFFKPTGDGLLILIPYTEENLDKTVTNATQICFKALVDFGSFCVNDPMINFNVPQKLGIGMSRGTACRLFSEDKILDYSGRVLNLASRLMDLARPSGIVFDDTFGIECLSEKLTGLFEKDSVYIRGIAEKEPIDIYYSKDYTRISPLNKQPIEEVKWITIEDEKTLKQIRARAPNFLYDLSSKPVDPSQIKVRISHPLVTKGRKVEGTISLFDFDNFEYFLEAGKPTLRLKFNALAERLEKAGVKRGWIVTIKVMYPEKQV